MDLPTRAVTPNPDSAKQLYRLWAELDPWQREVFDGLRTNPPNRKDKEPGVDRRQATVAIVTVPFIPAEARERIAAADRFPVDASLVKAHEQTAAALATRYKTADLDAFGAAVAAYADRLLALLDRPSVRSGLRDRLVTVTVELCAEAGMLGLHAGDRTMARRYLGDARDLAIDSGDLVLHAKALGASANLYSPRVTGGRHGNHARAAEMLEQANAQARSADWSTQADLALWRAGEHSLVPAADDCQRCIEQAVYALSRPQGETEGFFSPAGMYGNFNERLRWTQGLARIASGRPGDAEKPLAEVLRSTSSPRLRVKVLADLGAARVGAEEPEGACAALTDALDRALAIGYVTGIERIRGVRARFPGPWASLACVRQLDERLAGRAAR